MPLGAQLGAARDRRGDAEMRQPLMVDLAPAGKLAQAAEGGPRLAERDDLGLAAEILLLVPAARWRIAPAEIAVLEDLEEEAHLTLRGEGRGAGDLPRAGGVDDHLQAFMARRQRPGRPVLHEGEGL